MEGEENEEEKITEEGKQLSDYEQATKSDGTTKVSEATDPITLDEILTQAGISIQERKTFKEELSFWWPDNLLDLAPADIITKLQYCSRKARQALYTIASQLSEQGDVSSQWNPSWDAKALMTSGMYHRTFQALWQVRAQTKVSQKTGQQDEFSIPKKKINLQVISVRPDEDWVTSRDEILAELARDSRFLKLSTSFSAYNYEEARATEGNDPMNYCTTNLRAWIAKCIASDVMVAPNPEWLLLFMLTYSITLEPYEDIAQEFQKRLVQEERTPTWKTLGICLS